MRGRPFMSTSTTGVPVAATASNSCSWTPGNPSDERLAASPLMSPRSPSTRIATLACRAAATASANPAVALSSMPEPCAYTTCVPATTFDLTPCSTVTTSDARHEPAPPRFRPRACDAVVDQFRDGRPVADDEACEAPLAPQHRVGEPRVPRRGHARDVIERRHETRDAGVHRRLERRQVDLAHRALRDR